jgi:hypothetical protein
MSTIFECTFEKLTLKCNTVTAGVIMSGVFVDDYERSKLNCLGRWYKPWFYKHAETFMESAGADYEYIPTVDFFHRHNKYVAGICTNSASFIMGCKIQKFLSS